MIRLLGIMNGNNNAGRPQREWLYDIVDWDRASVRIQDGTKWNKIIKETSDSNRSTRFMVSSVTYVYINITDVCIAITQTSMINKHMYSVYRPGMSPKSS